MFLLEYIIFAVETFSWYSDPETYIGKQVFFTTKVLALDIARKPSNPDENQQEKLNKKVSNLTAINTPKLRCCLPSSDKKIEKDSEDSKLK